MKWGTTLVRACQNPFIALSVISMVLRGNYYRLKYKILRKKVVIGRGFRVSGRLAIKGPGTVIFGDNCTVMSSRLAMVTPFTHSPDAVIRFGNQVMLSGTRLGCQHRIEVGEGADLADTRIMDTDFHAVEMSNTPRRNTSGRAKPVIIGPNAWLGTGSMILKGVTIGANSIVGAGAVVMRSVPPNSVVVGNPARVVWRLATTLPNATPSPKSGT